MQPFRIPVVPETTSKSIRFPNDLIQQIDAALCGTSCSFSAFVVEAVRIALADLKDDQQN